MIVVVASGLAFLSVTTMPAGADALPCHEYYMTLPQGEIGQFSDLEAPCGSTGLHLVVYHVPPGIEVTQTGTIVGTRTCSCCPPPPGCCDQAFVVYSIRSSTPGQYDIEFRVGRGDASLEYYEVDILHVTVASSVTISTQSSASLTPPETSSTAAHRSIAGFYTESVLLALLVALFILLFKRGRPSHLT